MKKLLSIFIAILILISIGFASINYFFDSNNDDPGSKEIVVLLHGLGRTNASMWLLSSRLKEAGYHVQRVGYSSLDQSPEKILQAISQQIDLCCKEHAYQVHFVGHSLGGLMVRAYLQNNQVENLARVVLLGTPNQGATSADYFSDSWLMRLLGPTAKVLGTDTLSFPRSLELPYYPVGIIAGELKSEFNEGFIPGKDDGLVSVEETKINGMTDFILIETDHSMMRYNKEVAKQTIEFIKHGAFKK